MMVKVMLGTLVLLLVSFWIINTFTQPQFDVAQSPYATVGPANDLNTYPGNRYFTTVPVPGSPGLVMRVL